MSEQMIAALAKQLEHLERMMEVKLEAIAERQTSMQALMTDNLVGVRQAQHEMERSATEREHRLRDVEELTRNLPERMAGLDGRIEENTLTITRWKAQVAVLAAMFTAVGAAGAAGVMQVFGGG